MQSILNDIELDVAELRCLLQALSAGYDPKLAAVAGRNISRLKQQLDELQRLLTPQATAKVSPAPLPPTEEETPPAPLPPAGEETAPAPLPPTGEETPLAPLPPTEEETPPAPLPPTEEKDKEPPSPVQEEEKEEEKNAPSVILAERIRPAQDLRHALSLNDTFRFARELFEGDVARLHQLLRQLSETASWDEAQTLLSQETHTPEDLPARTELEELLKKYFD